MCRIMCIFEAVEALVVLEWNVGEIHIVNERREYDTLHSRTVIYVAILQYYTMVISQVCQGFEILSGEFGTEIFKGYMQRHLLSQVLSTNDIIISRFQNLVLLFEVER